MSESKPYTLRGLQAKDLFLMARIIGDIGFKELSRVFDDKVDIGAITILDGDEIEVKADSEVIREIGYGVVIDIIGIIIEHLPDCQDNLFKFLSQISDLSERKVGELPLGDFMDMLTDVFTMPEFSDFFGRAARLIK